MTDAQKGANMHSIIQAVAHWSVQTPDTLCAADSRRALTYGEMFRLAAGFADDLISSGIREGDCVVLRNSQDTAYVAATLGIQLAGAVSVPLEKNVAEARICEICESTDAALYLAAKPWEEGKLRQMKISEALQHEADDAVCAAMRERAEQIPEEKMAEILFSTGTTGKSKGIVLQSGNNIAVAQNIIEGVEMKKGNVELIPIPLSHSHALRTLYAAMLNGSSVVLLDGVVFVARVFALMEKYQVTAIDLVPAALAMLLKLAPDQLSRWDDRLDYVELGSAPIPEGDKAMLCRILPGTRLYNFYGSTESGRTCALNFNDGVVRRACIGKPVSNASCEFFDGDGKRIEATAEHPGVLAWRGPMNTPGYFHDEEKNRELFRDGSIITQDLAYQGKDGMIYMLGRQGDVITCGGTKIAPTEVEEAADSIPGIAETACVPEADEMLGQVPKLYYVLEDGANLTGQDIDEKLRGLLEGYKVPRTFVQIDRLPKTYNGKIQRNKLK